MDYSKLKINCLGASNTQVTKTEDKHTVWDVNYPSMLASLLHCEVRNYGASGTNIAADGQRTDSYYERAPLMDTDADVVILQGDGNDASHKLPLGTPGDSDPHTFCGAIAGCISVFREKMPGAKIVSVTGMKKLHQPERDDGLTHEDFHRAFIDTCRVCGVEPHDFGADPLLSWENPDIMPDGLHMSEKGCRHYVEVVAELIRKLYE